MENEMNRSGRRNFGSSSVNRNGISRGSFLRGAGAVVGGVAAAGLGLGDVAGATGANPILDDYELSHQLYFSTCNPNGENCGFDGGIPFSATKYLYVTCGNQQISPIAKELVSSNNDPGSDRWVRTAGDVIYVPDFPRPDFPPNPDLVKPAMDNGNSWDMDPVTGFTQAKLDLSRITYGGTIIPAQFNDLHVDATLTDLSTITTAIFLGGFAGSEVPQTIITKLSDVPRPSAFPEEQISALDSQTTIVEFTVPASPFQEYGLKQVVGNYMQQLVMNQLLDPTNPRNIDYFISVCTSYPTTFIFCPILTSKDLIRNQKAEYLSRIFMSISAPKLMELKGYDGNGLPYDIPEPVNFYKLRGWFIKGEGIESDDGVVHNPLVIYSHGWAGTLFYPGNEWNETGARNIRRMAYYLAMQGYSVLIYDQEAHGISEGWNRGHIFSPATPLGSPGVQLNVPSPTPANNFGWSAVFLYQGKQVLKGLLDINTFQPLLDFKSSELQYTGFEDPVYGKVYYKKEQFVVKILLPYPGYIGGQSPIFIDWDTSSILPLSIPNPVETGNAVNIFHMIDQLADQGLIADASSTPIILAGTSQGSMTAEKAMQLRFATPAGLVRDYSHYNLRGIISTDSSSGSIKFTNDYSDTPLGFRMISESIAREFFGTVTGHDGDVHRSIQYWPGYLGLQSIYDFFDPNGTVMAYNRARGTKGIAMVKGWHDWGLMFEPNFSYIIKKMVKFCKKVTLNEPEVNNTATTTLRNELCKVPDFDMSTLGEPPFRGKLFGANNSLERLIENVKKQYPI